MSTLKEMLFYQILKTFFVLFLAVHPMYMCYICEKWRHKKSNSYISEDHVLYLLSLPKNVIVLALP